jgi:hypothetical protein
MKFDELNYQIQSKNKIELLDVPIGKRLHIVVQFGHKILAQT